MKKQFSLIIGMLAFLLVVQGASASQTCSDITFSVIESTLETNHSFTLKIQLDDTPHLNQWGNFTSATLSLSSGLTTSDNLTVNLSASNLGQVSYPWSVLANQSGIYQTNVSFVGSESCEKPLNLTVGEVTNPNLVLSSSLSSTNQTINSPYTLTVNVSNAGNEGATSVVVTVSASGGNSTVTPSSRTVSTLASGANTALQFTINSPTTGTDLQITSTAAYKDTAGQSMADVPSPTTVNVTGYSFTANQSQTVDAQTLSAAILNITTNESTDLSTFTISNSSSNSNSAPSGKTAAGRYTTVTLPSDFSSKLQAASLKVFYQQTEVDNNNINEGTLKLYRFNTTTNVWDALTSTVDTSTNSIEATVPGFSTFGLFGDVNAAPATTNTGGSTTSSGPLLKACTGADYLCSDWTACSTSSSQTRTCSKKTTSKCMGDATPATTQSCTYTAPICTPNWECTSYSACSAGSQTRSCIDNNNCGTGSGKPTESQTCAAPVSEVVQPTAGGLTGFLVSQSVLQYKASAGASTGFKIDDLDHILTVKEVKTNSVVLVIQSEPVEVEIKVGESKQVNIDADPENDISIKLNTIENGVALLTVDKISSGSNGIELGAIAVVVIIVIAGVFLVRRKKNK